MLKDLLYTQIRAWTPTVIWCLLIFWGSTDECGGVQSIKKLIALLHYLFSSLSEADLLVWVFYIRKACHVTEYAILAAFVFWGFLKSGLVGWNRFWSSRMAILTFVVCVSYAASDEYHQSFTSERQGCVKDVMIDTGGVSLGIAGMYVVSLIRHKRAKKREQLESDLL